jgi:hypothetical protein
MRPRTKLIAMCGASAVMLLTYVAAPAAADDDGGHGSSVKVLLTDLNGPKGLGVNAARDVVVAQGGFSDPTDTTDPGGPVLLFHTRGPAKGTAEPITDPFQIVDVAISPLDDTGWAIGTDLHLYHQLADGSIIDILDIPAYQAADPDPVDQEGNGADSNPYGLAVARNGDALVADAAGNDLLRVTPDGVATTVARFDVESVSTDHIPPDPANPLPPMFDTEAVPTTVVVGPDGAIYVGELKGFPFRPGTSRIWRIKPGATDAWCSVNSPAPPAPVPAPAPGACRSYSSGYTSIQDIAFGNGKLYVYELAAGGAGAFEEGFAPGGQFPPAVLLEVSKKGKGRRTELAAGQLSQPGGIVVVKGKIYVTDGMFTGGRLLQIRRGGDDNHEDEGHDD